VSRDFLLASASYEPVRNISLHSILLACCRRVSQGAKRRRSRHAYTAAIVAAIFASKVRLAFRQIESELFLFELSAEPSELSYDRLH
jgi:hypothetical protein